MLHPWYVISVWETQTLSGLPFPLLFYPRCFRQSLKIEWVTSLALILLGNNGLQQAVLSCKGFLIDYIDNEIFSTVTTRPECVSQLRRIQVSLL